MKNTLLLLLSLLFCFLYCDVGNGHINNTLVNLSIVVIAFALSTFFWTSTGSGLTNIWVKPSNIFIIAFSAVAFQYIFDYAYGVKTDTSLIHPEVINKCLCLGVVGFLSFIFGYNSDISKLKYPISFSTQNRFLLGEVPFFIIIGQILCFLIFLQGIGVSALISGRAYAGGNELQKGIHTYMEMLLYDINAVIVVYVCYNKKFNSFKQYLSSFPLICLIVLILYLFFRLLSGDRGPVIFTCMLLFLGYLYASNLKVKFLKACIAGLISITLISLIGIARKLDTERSFGERLTQSSEIYQEAGRFGLKEDYEGTLFPPTEEIAGSYMITFISVNDIERNNGSYSYGFFQLIQILNCIPFMNSFVHYLLPYNSEDFSSSAKANYLFFSGYDRNWGVGTNALGDIFWDFGVFGVFVCFIFIGKVFSWIDQCLVGKNRYMVSIFFLLFALMFGAKAVYLPRSTFLSEMRNYVWSVILLWICLRNKKLLLSGKSN